MSHPTYWPNRTFFYPIGNTPPICLTDYLPRNEDATVLLLGCGDPRSILYTVATEKANSTRAMDITCCDWEPAIIARNVLLLTFIADSVDTRKLVLYWSIFYDLFLDKDSILLLKEQCNKLVRFATNIATWEASPYGSFLKFATEASLNEACRHWNSYIETVGLSNAQQKRLKTMFLSTMQESKDFQTFNLSAIPSAAPASAEFVGMSTKACSEYWRTGITSPDVNSSTAKHINPTFLFSVAGRQFNLHYGTDLCSAFHLVFAVAKVMFQDGSPSKPCKTVRDVWNACREQFSRWAVALNCRLVISGKESPLIIRFVVGEALAFCDALLLCKTGDFTPTVYSSMWGSAKFSFIDTSIPISFNVVDTSNLSDHIGLFNILIAIIPLLLKGPHTVLNTSTLLSYHDHPTQRSALIERALLDFPSIALLLGIIPICYSSGLTFRNCSEGANFATFGSATGIVNLRHYERVSWKFSDYVHAKWDGTSTQQTHDVQFEPNDLADKLFEVYTKMFKDENPFSLLEHLHISRITTFRNCHYHRQSFVRFIKVVRSLGHVGTSWSSVLDRLLERIMTDTQSLIGPNNAQSLFADLQIWGVHSFLPDSVEDLYGKNAVPFKSWVTIPPVVCLVLKVPRTALKFLDDVPPKKIGNPTLECITFNGHLHNIHDSIRPIFGDFSDSGDQTIIVEDPNGIKGDSPLIVSFFVSSWILADSPGDLQVALCLKTTPVTSVNFFSKLGPMLSIYSTPLLNQANVLILPERPDNIGELQRRASMIPPRPCVDPMLGVTKFFKQGTNEILSKRLEIVEAPAKDALANKALIKVKQKTPCCMEVTIGGQHRYLLYYPIFVDGSRSKTRIARKSSYIEVDVPHCTSPFDIRDLQPFPLTLNHGIGRFQFFSWDAPYVNLDSLPIVSLTKTSKWIDAHLAICLSRRERHLQELQLAPAESWGSLLNFKMSIINILLRHAQEKNRIYVLQDHNRLRPHAILFLTAIRIDPASATIVGDTAVIFPASVKDLPIRVFRGASVAVIKVYNDEIRWWNHALPVFAERCRQWEHLSTCEYLQYQRVPLSVQYEETPLCSCGKGKDLGPFNENIEWKNLAPHATRIALTPIFPVTYLEDVTEEALAGIFN